MTESTETKRRKKAPTLGWAIDRIRAIDASADSDRRLAAARAAAAATDRFNHRIGERKWEVVNQLPSPDRETAIEVLKLEPLADGVPSPSETTAADPAYGAADGEPATPDSFGGTDEDSHRVSTSVEPDLSGISPRLRAQVEPLPPGHVVEVVDKGDRKTGTARR